MKLIILYRLKPDVDRQDFESWLRVTHHPFWESRPSIDRLTGHSAYRRIFDDGSASVQHIDILDVAAGADFAEAGLAPSGLEDRISAFPGFAEKPEFILCERLPEIALTPDILRAHARNFTAFESDDGSGLNIKSVRPGFKLGIFEQTLTSNRLLSHCLFSDKFGGRPVWGGSGFAVTPHHIVTAGHVAVNVEHGPRQGIQGLNRNSGQGGTRFDVQDVRIHERFRRFGDAQFDIAVIRTRQALAHHITPFQSFARTRAEIGEPGGKLHVTGYPLRKGTHLNLCWGVGHILARNANVVAHSINTLPGMSGGMILTDEPENGVASRVIGVHIEGFRGRAGGFGDKRNKGLLLTETLVNWIRSRLN